MLILTRKFIDNVVYNHENSSKFSIIYLHALKEWFELQYTNCLATVSQTPSGPRGIEYYVKFEDPSQETLFRVKYSEYL